MESYRPNAADAKKLADECRVPAVIILHLTHDGRIGFTHHGAKRILGRASGWVPDEMRAGLEGALTAAADGSGVDAHYLPDDD